MNRNVLIAGAIVAVGLVAAAVVLNKDENAPASGSASSAAATGQLPALLPGIDKQLDSITRIALRSAEGTATLERKDGQWTVVENEGYLAQQDRVAKMLASLGAMTTTEKMTSRKEMLDRLGLAEAGKEGSPTIEVKLFGEGDKELGALLVGNVRSGANREQERFVRKVGEDQAWAVRTPLQVDAIKDSWTQKEILNVGADRIRRFEVDPFDTEPVAVARAERPTDAFAVEAIPAGKELARAEAASSLAASLASLNFDTVKRDLAFFDQLTSETLVQATTFDGLAIKSRWRKEGTEATWATFDVAYDEGLRPTGDVAASLKSVDDTKKEADEIAARTKGWVFRIPSWKAGTLDRTINTDLLRTIEVARGRQILVTWEGAPQSTVTGRTQEEARARAVELRDRVMADPSIFADLATAESDCETRDTGGDLGEVKRDQLANTVETALFDLAPGAVSEVIESPFGFHILKRE